MYLFYTSGHLSTSFIFVRVFRNVLQYKCSVGCFIYLRYMMIESIAFALFLKKIQIAFVAIGVLFDIRP